MKIGSFARFTDRAGLRAPHAVIATQGCAWRCPGCGFPDLVDPACYGRTVAEEQVLGWLAEHRAEVAAVVLTGGEPTYQPDLPDFIEEVRELGLPVHLETNGAHPAMLQQLLYRGALARLALDLKAPLHNYGAAAGARVDVEAVRRSLWIARQAQIPVEITMTPIPGLHTTEELRELARFLKGAAKVVFYEYNPAQALRADFRLRRPYPPRPLDNMGRYFAARVKAFELRRGWPVGEEIDLAATAKAATAPALAGA